MHRLVFLGLVLVMVLGFTSGPGFAGVAPAESGDDKAATDVQASQAAAGQSRPTPPPKLSKQEDKSIRDIYRLHNKKPKPQ